MNRSELEAQLDEQLRARVVERTEADPDTWVFTHPRAISRAARVSVGWLLERVAEASNPRVWTASFLEGLAAVVKPVPTKGIETLEFVDAAGRLVARLDGPGFLEGVSAAGGAAPWVRPWHQDLLLTFWVEFDRGAELLREDDVARWGCTGDRVWAAARSILFHKSREQQSPVTEQVARYRVGDGYDAARVIVVEDLEWQRSGNGLWVGLPSDGELLFRVPSVDTEALESFKTLVENAWRDADYPLVKSPMLLQGDTITVL